MFANLDNIFIGQRFVRLVILRVLEQHFVHVSRRVLVQFVRTAEDDQSDLAIAQHRQLVGLLHHAEFALVERHLQVSAAIFRRQKNVITWPKKNNKKIFMQIINKLASVTQIAHHKVQIRCQS